MWTVLWITGQFFIESYISKHTERNTVASLTYIMYLCYIHYCCQAAAAILTQLEAVSMATPPCRIKTKRHCLPLTPCPTPNKLLPACNTTASSHWRPSADDRTFSPTSTKWKMLNPLRNSRSFSLFSASKWKCTTFQTDLAPTQTITCLMEAVLHYYN